MGAEALSMNPADAQPSVGIACVLARRRLNAVNGAGGSEGGYFQNSR